jgi:cation:H+ antiporter
MVILLDLLLLIFGLVLLWWSGERSVLYTNKLSKIYNLGTFFLGFVLLAVSTGIPEFSVAIQSILSNVPALSVGDIIGSNFLDVSAVLGIPILTVGTIFVSDENYKNAIFMCLVNVFLMSVIFFSKVLMPIHGVVFITIYLLSCWYLWRFQKSDYSSFTNNKNKNHVYSRGEKLIVFSNLFVSILFVLIASKLCVSSAINLVKQTTISLNVLGTTILAIGTSFPELTLSLAAIKRKDYALALGNSLGSVLEQGSLIIGFLAIFSKTPVNTISIRWVAPFFYAAFLIIGNGIIFRRKINRIEGFLLVLLTLIFFIYGYSAQLFG